MNKIAIEIDTIGAYVAQGYEMYANCLNVHCQHRKQMDLEKLAARIGTDHSCLAKDLTPRLRCSRCNGKQVQLTVIPYGKNGPKHP